MRPKINTQSELNFQPSNLEITNNYYAKYDAISTILDENPRIVNVIHNDLAQALEESAIEDRHGAKFKYTSDTILRVLLCQIIEGCSLREIVIRIDDSNFLHFFVRIFNDQKIFSIFEPHTELLKRGKAGKLIEFGHMIQIQQVNGKFITDYDVFEAKPVEYELIEPALEHHKKLFGDYPDKLAADKGYYKSMWQIEDLGKKVEVVAIAKKGKRTEEQTRRETDPAFRHAQRFRAGVEGTISFLKRVLGLFRCYNKGWEHYVSTVGATILAHNLLILARC